MPVQWTDEAKANLRAIERYIAKDNPRAAAKTVLKIINRTNAQLAAYPSSGIAGRIAGTKELIFLEFPYIVIYTLRDNTISVITVFHAARNLVAADEA